MNRLWNPAIFPCPTKTSRAARMECGLMCSSRAIRSTPWRRHSRFTTRCVNSSLSSSRAPVLRYRSVRTISTTSSRIGNASRSNKKSSSERCRFAKASFLVLRGIIRQAIPRLSRGLVAAISPSAGTVGRPSRSQRRIAAWLPESRNVRCWSNASNAKVKMRCRHPAQRSGLQPR
jgi:hypothetical protein